MVYLLKALHLRHNQVPLRWKQWHRKWSLQLNKLFQISPSRLNQLLNKDQNREFCWKQARQLNHSQQIFKRGHLHKQTFKIRRNKFKIIQLKIHQSQKDAKVNSLIYIWTIRRGYSSLRLKFFRIFRKKRRFSRFVCPDFCPHGQNPHEMVSLFGFIWMADKTSKTYAFFGNPEKTLV